MKNKKDLRICFMYFWPGFNQKDNFFTNILSKKYNVILDRENPVLVFFSLYPGKSISLIRRIYRYVKIKFFNITSYYTPKIKGDAKKIFFTPENYVPNFNRCDLALGFEYEEKVKNKKYLRLPLYFFDRADKNLSKKKLQTGENYFERKFCNFIYNHNIKFRNHFFKELSKYKKIDSPGECMNNHEKTVKTYSKKIDFLKDYKFTIAFENSCSSGYTTEKLPHPMMANSLPIYFGNPEVKKDFNGESFLILKSKKKKHVRELIEKIIELDSNKQKYMGVLKKPWFKERSLKEYCNEKKVLKKIESLIKKDD